MIVTVISKMIVNIIRDQNTAEFGWFLKMHVQIIQVFILLVAVHIIVTQWWCYYMDLHATYPFILEITPSPENWRIQKHPSEPCGHNWLKSKRCISWLHKLPFFLQTILIPCSAGTDPTLSGSPWIHLHPSELLATIPRSVDPLGHGFNDAASIGGQKHMETHRRN